MVSSLKLVLPLFAIIGFSTLVASFFRMALAPFLLIITAGIGVLEFLLALTGYLPQGTLVILYVGIAVFIYTQLLDYSRRRTAPVARDNISTSRYYFLFSAVIALFVWGMRFRSIDDYSFWGIMSKYLFVFNQLPTDNHYINDNFLTYIPGMSSFHYLFYTAAGRYSQFAGYLAQGIVLLSALMVLFDARAVRDSLLKIALVFIALTVGFGTIFARMEVDGYVAVYLFAIFWMIYKFRDDEQLGLLVFFPILFLSLIKEIGILFAIMSIIAFFVTAKKSKKNIVCSVLLLAGVVGLKWMWVIHCQHYGFHSFARAVTLPNALDALNPLNPYFHAVQWLFLKGVFLGRFGHILAWPNVVSYALIVLIWRVLMQHLKQESHVRAVKLQWVFLATIVIYLLMLYWLQALVFAVGHTQDHLLDFQRYFNMLLIPFTLFSVLIYFEERGLPHCQARKAPLSIAIAAIAFIFIISGKVERTHRYYLPQLIYPLVDRVKTELPMQGNWNLCLQNPPSPTYEVSMPLAYFFLPHQIILSPESAMMAQCDYTMEWSENNNIAQINIKIARSR